MSEMSLSVKSATNEITRVKQQSGSANVNFIKSICRKLSDPIENYAGKVKKHIEVTTVQWDILENSYLSLLDNKFVLEKGNRESIQGNMSALEEMQSTMIDSNGKIEKFIDALRGSIGMERRLNRAVTLLVSELEQYLLLTERISSSVDRILAKSEVAQNSNRY